MEIVNRTEKSEEEIRRLEKIADYRNDWRMRRVEVFEEKEGSEMVYSVGTSYDDSLRVICLEPRSGFTRGIAAFRDGKRYVEK